jgi:hypothetical protein
MSIVSRETVQNIKRDNGKREKVKLDTAQFLIEIND